MKLLKVISLCALYFLIQSNFLLHLDYLPFSGNSVYSDLVITHLPNATYLINSLQKYGEIPLWSNTILSGYPFIANPLSGIAYPFGWIALLFPLPFGFNLVVSLHLILGAFGFYYLLKEKGLSEVLAIMGGALFLVIPKLWAHIAAGHLTFTYAFCWTPWLLYTTIKPSFRQRFLPGVIFGFILLADVRWGAYAGLLWIMFYFLNIKAIFISIRALTNDIFSFVMQGILGMLLASPLLIPLLEYSRLSTRSMLTTNDRLSFSLGTNQLLGLVFPDFSGYTEWIIYPGGVFFIAYLWAWWDGSLRKNTRFLRWSILLTVFFSMGSNFPLLSWIFSLPGFDLLRVPPRFMLIGSIFWIILTIQWIEHLFNHRSDLLIHVKPIRLGLVGLNCTLVIFTSAVWLVTSKPPINLIWGSIVVLLTSITLFIYISKPSPAFVYFIFGIALMDLVGFAQIHVSYHSQSEIAFQGKAVAEYLSDRVETSRVYSPSYSFPQHTAAAFNDELADGIDPLQLESYALYFEKASGVKMEGYSVTLPSYKSADPKNDNRDAIPNPKELGKLNVRFIAAEYPIFVDGFDLIQQIGSTWIYRNRFELPRAWIQKYGTPGGESIEPVNRMDWAPNRIYINGTGPGLLVISENYYPGWIARIDGKPAKIIAVDGIFRGIDLIDGIHEVEMEFAPTSFYAGLVLAVIAILWIIARNWRRID